MANPLYKAILSGSAGLQNGPSNLSGPDAARRSGPQISPQDALRQLQQNPAGMIKQAGFNVPDEYTHDPQSAAMYLIQTGQVGGPIMRRIQPMLNMLMGRK